LVLKCFWMRASWKPGTIKCYKPPGRSRKAPGEERRSSRLRCGLHPMGSGRVLA
jgi:hypothetical protein